MCNICIWNTFPDCRDLSTVVIVFLFLSLFMYFDINVICDVKSMKQTNLWWRNFVKTYYILLSFLSEVITIILWYRSTLSHWFKANPHWALLHQNINPRVNIRWLDHLDKHKLTFVLLLNCVVKPNLSGNYRSGNYIQWELFDIIDYQRLCGH